MAALDFSRVGAKLDLSILSEEQTQSTDLLDEESGSCRDVKVAVVSCARTLHREQFLHSSVTDRSFLFPKFEREEIEVGPVLGIGGFGAVYEVRSFANQDRRKQFVKKGSSSLRNLESDQEDNCFKADKPVAGGQMESRNFIATHCTRDSGEARYAIKTLCLSKLKDEKSLLQGIAGMATEARILSNLEHPHVVKLRAHAGSSPFRADYFLVLDGLYDTLEQRIRLWAKKQRRYSGIAGKFTDVKGRKRARLYEERLVAASALSAGVAYLHKQRIIHRDLKPENIGFDIRGDIKIFDFGLAKPIPNIPGDEDGLYNFTGMCGSPRYMAPEVALGKPYNQSCDVYSFAHIFWSMLVLQRPYAKHTLKDLYHQVWAGPCKRPAVDPKWTTSIQIVFRRSWAKNVGERLGMGAIETILTREAIQCTKGGDRELDHARRRSTHVFGRKTTRAASITIH